MHQTCPIRCAVWATARTSGLPSTQVRWQIARPVSTDLTVIQAARVMLARDRCFGQDRIRHTWVLSLTF